jgi:Fe-S cluster biogenesis protein NfuA
MPDGARGEGDRIARLLDEIQAMAGPTTWQRVEELVRSLVTMYGDALGRVLAVAREGGALEPSRAARLCEDELVSSLLLLHGLHPLPTAERVARAVEALRERLAPDVGVQLEAIGEDHVARVRVDGEARGCGGAGAGLARGIENALLEAAPELARVEIEGLTVERSERLVTLGAPARATGGAPR